MITIPVQGTNFSFSAVVPDSPSLDASKYCLVHLVCDRSGSVGSFQKELVEALNMALGASRKSPEANNLMVRGMLFNSQLEELHGFRLLTDVLDYQQFDCSGTTALFNATHSAVESTAEYARLLTEQGNTVNGIAFIITDGDDNSSTSTPERIKKAIDAALASENLESLQVVVVAINAAEHVVKIKDFATGIGAEFVDIGDATPQRLAKFAGFVSRSMSSSSQSLGSGKSAPIVKPSF
jgi:hypothetical protein